jgi:hypothetical protein
MKRLRMHFAASIEHYRARCMATLIKTQIERVCQSLTS